MKKREIVLLGPRLNNCKINNTALWGFTIKKKTTSHGSAVLITMNLKVGTMTLNSVPSFGQGVVIKSHRIAPSSKKFCLSSIFGCTWPCPVWQWWGSSSPSASSTSISDTDIAESSKNLTLPPTTSCSWASSYLWPPSFPWALMTAVSSACL